MTVRNFKGKVKAFFRVCTAPNLRSASARPGLPCRSILRCTHRRDRRCPRHAAHRNPGCTWCSGRDTAPGNSRTAAPWRSGSPPAPPARQCRAPLGGARLSHPGFPPGPAPSGSFGRTGCSCQSGATRWSAPASPAPGGPGRCRRESAGPGLRWRENAVPPAAGPRIGLPGSRRRDRR